MPCELNVLVPHDWACQPHAQVAQFGCTALQEDGYVNAVVNGPRIVRADCPGIASLLDDRWEECNAVQFEPAKRSPSRGVEDEESGSCSEKDAASASEKL